MSRDPDLLRDVVSAVRVRPPHSFTWLGRSMPEPPPGPLRDAMLAEPAREQLAARIRFQLYHSFYCAGAIVVKPAGGPRERLADGFLDALSAANCGAGRWQPGWEVRDVGGSVIGAVRNGLTVEAPFEDCRPPGSALRPGDAVALRFPNESDRRSLGFYMAFGELEFEPETPAGIVRVYWHLRSDGAPRLVRLLTSLLNGAELPFLLKVVDRPDGYLRCDAGVLYLRVGDWSRAAAAMARVHGAVRGALREATSPFAKRLAAGLAVAEEPLTGESFGMHRCRLLADGLVRGAERGLDDVEPRLRVVLECFAEEGIDLDRAHLNPGSTDAYELAPAIARGDVGGARRAVAHERDDAPARWTAAARTIGTRLCAQAFWHDGRCSWIGTEPSVAPSVPGGRDARRSSALGPTVYSGTAGVGLFLAELARVADDGDVRRTALGAIRHALRHAGRVPLQQRLGLYTGALGIALAAARVGVLLGDDECVCGARTLARDCLRERPAEREFDLMAGDAGAIVALLGLAQLVGDPGMRDAAIGLGDELLAAADRDGGALCWSSPSWPGAPALTGLSHGAAGAGLALLELHAATGAPRWRAAACAAFEYERRWFDGGAANWRDLRPLPGNVPYMVAWCHGAPGIALSRLRAAQLIDHPRLRDEAAAGLQTTIDAVHSAMRHGVDDFSLCHGLAGNADVLLLAAQLGASADVAATVKAVGRFGLDGYLDAGRPWACGTIAGESPGLMMGLSGIGLFYLRLADPAVLPALLPLPALVTVTEPVRPVAIAAPDASRESADVVAFETRLDGERLRAIVREAMSGHGFSFDPALLEAAAGGRWHVGLALRDRVLPAGMPDFADAIDYLSLPDVDPQLWNSLPFMLAFGHEQALVLAALAGVEAATVPEIAEACAVFSALLSAFDHAVDERPFGDAVFGVERAAVSGLFDAGGADDALAATYAAVPDLPVRLVCILFGVLGQHVRRLAQRADERAVAELEEVTLRLFAAERTCTLGRPRTHAQLRALARASRDKSVLPFVTLMRIVGLAAPDLESRRGLQRASALGEAILLADDLVDLLDDLRAGAPSPLVLAVVERAAARGAHTATDEDILDVVRDGAGKLVELLDPSRFADAEVDADVAELVAFARLSVARWVGWTAEDARRRDRPAALATGVAAAC